jgi:carbonic anhydrase
MNAQRTHIAALLKRNEAFATTEDRQHVMPIPFIPRQQAFVITCIDPRVDPAAFLGIQLGDAIVLRNVGGRVTEATLRDVAYISYLIETKAPDGPYFEAAVIHHTDCGSGLLADDELRRGFAERAGYDEPELAELAVVDPAQTVKTDVQRLLTAPQLSPRISVSGHVYDVKTGLVATIIGPTTPQDPPD